MNITQRPFQSIHKLDYLQAPPYLGVLGGTFIPYKIGTCHGIFCMSKRAFKIVAVVNDNPGNGHFTDVLEWFEYAAKLNGKALEVVEIWNDPLRQHLINKRGFTLLKNGDVRKTFIS